MKTINKIKCETFALQIGIYRGVFLMNMKKAFEKFFEEMTQNYLNEWGVPPRVPYTCLLYTSDAADD